MVTTTADNLVADHHMRVDSVTTKKKKVLIVVSNPAKATTVGWDVGFWGAELTHPYYELTQCSIDVTIRQPGRGSGDNGRSQ